MSSSFLVLGERALELLIDMDVVINLLGLEFTFHSMLVLRVPSFDEYYPVFVDFRSNWENSMPI